MLSIYIDCCVGLHIIIMKVRQPNYREQTAEFFVYCECTCVDVFRLMRRKLLFLERSSRSRTLTDWTSRIVAFWQTEFIDCSVRTLVISNLALPYCLLYCHYKLRNLMISSGCKRQRAWVLVGHAHSCLTWAVLLRCKELLSCRWAPACIL